jgi:hypothetical protein
MTLRQVKRDTTSREFVRWLRYIRQKEKAATDKHNAEVQYACENPSMDQTYFADITRHLHALLFGKLLPRADFYIPFSVKDVNAPPPPELTWEERVAQADEIAKLKMFSFLGTPENFEGFRDNGRINSGQP